MIWMCACKCVCVSVEVCSMYGCMYECVSFLFCGACMFV